MGSLFIRLLPTPDGGEGNGSGGAAPPPGGNGGTATPQGGGAGDGKGDAKKGDADVEAMVQGILAKHGGSADRALGYLLRDNQSYRRKLADMKQKSVPDGHVAVALADAQLIERYKALGKVEDLQAAIADRDHLKAEAEHGHRVDLHRQAAEGHGYRVTVLTDLLERDKLEIEVREEAVGGRKQKVAFVKGEDDKGKPRETRLNEYATQHWKDYLPALQETRGDGRGRPAGPAPSPHHAAPPAPPGNPQQRGIYARTPF
jgi:hypothetical protein